MTQTLSQHPADVEAEIARARRARTWRRVGTGVLALVVAGGLLGLYGPREETQKHSSAWGQASVTHPRAVRAGTDVALEVEVFPATAGAPWTLSVDLTWVERLGIETVTPEPSRESTEGGEWRLVFDEDPADTVLLSGRVPTHARVGSVSTRATVRLPEPGGGPDAEADFELSTWVLP